MVVHFLSRVQLKWADDKWSSGGPWTMQQFQFCASRSLEIWATCIRSKQIIMLKEDVTTHIYNHWNGKWKQHKDGSIWFKLFWVLWTSALLLSLLSIMHVLRLLSVIYGLFLMQQWLQIEITLNKWTLHIWQQHFPRVGAKPLLCPWFISTLSLAKLCSSLNNYILSTSDDFGWVGWWLITLGKEYFGGKIGLMIVKHFFTKAMNPKVISILPTAKPLTF